MESHFVDRLLVRQFFASIFALTFFSRRNATALENGNGGHAEFSAFSKTFQTRHCNLSFRSFRHEHPVPFGLLRLTKHFRGLFAWLARRLQAPHFAVSEPSHARAPAISRAAIRPLISPLLNGKSGPTSERETWDEMKFNFEESVSQN